VTIAGGDFGDVTRAANALTGARFLGLLAPALWPAASIHAEVDAIEDDLLAARLARSEATMGRPDAGLPPLEMRWAAMSWCGSVSCRKPLRMKAVIKTKNGVRCRASRLGQREHNLRRRGSFDGNQWTNSGA
jgi:hypothetical protein